MQVGFRAPLKRKEGRKEGGSPSCQKGSSQGSAGGGQRGFQRRVCSSSHSNSKSIVGEGGSS